MNRSAVLIALSCALLCSCATSPKPMPSTQPAVADADAERKWQAFEQAESRYYQLDKQDFTAIDCDVDVPMADKMVQGLRSYFLSLGGKISFSDTLAAYHLTYAKRDGLHMTDPTMDVTMKPGTKAANPAMVEDGRQKMQNGMKALAAGVDTEITGATNFLESAKRDAYDILYVVPTEDGFTTSFRDKRSGAQVSSEAKGDHMDSKVTPPSNAGAVKYHADFDAMPDGKLLMRTMVEDVDQSQLMKSHSIMTMEYQSIGGVTFLKHISVKASIDSMQASHQEDDLEIELHNCKISR